MRIEVEYRCVPCGRLKLAMGFESKTWDSIKQSRRPEDFKQSRCERCDKATDSYIVEIGDFIPA